MGICKVNINGVNLEYEKGTTYREIAEDFASKYSDDIIIAYANGVLRELSKEVDEDCKLEFVTTGTKMGQDVYVRGAIFMMLKAFHNVVGDDKLKKISVEHSFGQAIYCDYEAEVPLSDALMMSVKAEMDRLCELNLPISIGFPHVSVEPQVTTLVLRSYPFSTWYGFQPKSRQACSSSANAIGSIYPNVPILFSLILYPARFSIARETNLPRRLLASSFIIPFS